LQTLEAIRDHVLEELKVKKYINIWDAGCAMGQEPYSLSMILHECMGHMYFRNVKILATDIDQSNLFEDIIANAIYPEPQIQRIPKPVFEKFFRPSEQEGSFQLSQDIRNSVSFQKHDLLSLIPPRGNFSLIVCKNVLLHFNELQRVEVIKMFHRALEEVGFLVMEQTQKLPEEVAELFEPVVAHSKIFRKIPAGL
jgi:chemotaxis protein methyltransferase CheR